MLTRRMKKLKEEEALRREEEAMQRVFEIPMVVEEIIHNLDFDDLKTCRRVCSMWKETTTKVILKKDDFPVRLTFDYEIQKFRKGSTLFGSPHKLQEKQLLTDLTEIVQKSNGFPSSIFIIDRGILEDPDLREFFKTQGKGIKTLGLCSMVGTTVDILTHCPNVESLHLLSRLENPSMMQIQFPKLKLFLSGIDSEFRFRNIIAPNLEVLQNFNVSKDTTDVVKAGKIHIVKELYLHKEDRPEKLQEFLSAGPRVESLIFWIHEGRTDENWRIRFTGPFRQLLDMSKDTLKDLSVSALGHLFENMKFPRFSQLKELCILDCSKSERIFPIRTNLPETFPNLKVLEVRLGNLNKDWDKYFPPPDAYIGRLTSVTRVEVRRNCTQKYREMYQVICPNATILDSFF